MCDVGEGDCDTDADCKGELRCGTDNCGMAVANGDLGNGKGICELGYFAAYRDQETGIVGAGILSTKPGDTPGDYGEWGCGSWNTNDDCCYDPTKTKEDEALTQN